MNLQPYSNPLLWWVQSLGFHPNGQKHHQAETLTEDLHLYCRSNPDVQSRNLSCNGFRANPEYSLCFSQFRWKKKNNIWCQLYENITSWQLTVKWFKIGDLENCSHFRTLSVHLQHVPATSPSCMHHLQYIFPKLQPLRRAKPSVDWRICWRAEISIINIRENLGREPTFFFF